MKEITVTFHNGESKIETKGFVGKACLEATKELKEKLGEVVSETPTGAMHQGAGAGQTATQGS